MTIPDHADLCGEECYKAEVIAGVQAALPREEQVGELADAFGVLSDRTRLKMLFALAQGELCVCDVAHVVRLSRSATSHQLKLLRHCRLVTSRAEGRLICYALSANGERILRLLHGVLVTLPSFAYSGALREAAPEHVGANDAGGGHAV